MIVDVHNLIGRRRFTAERTPEALLFEMDEALVDAAVVSCFPEAIDNSYVFDAVARYPQRLVGMFSANPNDPGAAAALEKGLMQGFRALRLDPVKHGFTADNLELLSPLLDVCERFGAPVWLCCTADVSCSPILAAELADAFPRVPLILGYMGFNYEAALSVQIAAKYPNVYLDPTAAMHQNLMRALRTAGPEKILLGSGTPEASYFPLEIQKLRDAVADEAALGLVLGGNAARLFRIARETGARA